MQAQSGSLARPMDERAARLAERLGSRDADAHCARALDIEMVRGSNLVFAMAREHRKAVVELLPRAARKTFTIREFARITSFLSKEDIRDILETNDDLTERFDAAIGLVADERGMLPPVAPSEDDVVDPYGRTDDIFVQSAEQLMPAVTASASFIRGIASGLWSSSDISGPALVVVHPRAPESCSDRRWSGGDASQSGRARTSYSQDRQRQR